MKYETLALIGALALASAVAEECHDYKLTFITKAKTSIAIDGKLDEADWAAAKPITDYGPSGWGRRSKGGYTPERHSPIRFRLVDAPNGQAKIPVAIAWNEPVGTVYTLEVTDLATGKKFSQPIEIRKL